MSIILRALKSSAGKLQTTKAQLLQNGEGFFHGRQSFVKKPPPVFFQVGKDKNKRVYVLAAILIVVVAFAFTMKLLSERNLNVAGRQLESQSQISPVISQEELPAAAAGIEGDIVTRARTAFAAGNYDESVKLFKEAINAEPDNAHLHNDLGMVFVKKGLFSNAEDEYKKALELDSKCAECFNNFGYLKSVLDEPVEAQKYLEKATSLSSSYPDPFFNLAVLYEKLGDIGNAVKCYRQFVSLYPNPDDELFIRVNKRIFELAGK